MPDFKIEDKPFEPMPGKSQTRYKWPWAELPVGKSFYCEPKLGQTVDHLIKQVQGAAYNFRRNGRTKAQGWDRVYVKCVKEGNGVRVYRVDPY